MPDCWGSSLRSMTCKQLAVSACCACWAQLQWHWNGWSAAACTAAMSDRSLCSAGGLDCWGSSLRSMTCKQLAVSACCACWAQLQWHWNGWSAAACTAAMSDRSLCSAGGLDCWGSSLRSMTCKQLAVSACCACWAQLQWHWNGWSAAACTAAMSDRSLCSAGGLDCWGSSLRSMTCKQLAVSACCACWAQLQWHWNGWSAAACTAAMSDRSLCSAWGA